MNKTIAYIVSNPGVNDARVIKMAHAAAKKGYKVHLFGTLKPGFDAFEEIENITFYRYEWKPINILFEKSLFFQLVRFINKKFAIYLAKKMLPYIKYFLFSSIYADEISKINPDLIHAHDLICLPTAKHASTINNVPYIYDAHELEIHRNPPLPWLQKMYVKYIETKYSKDASCVITVGRYVANELAKHLPNAKIEVLYNSPIRNESPYKLRKDLKIADNKKILLYVGKVAMGRGIEEIIKILPSLSSDIIFATVGPFDPKQKALLKKMAEKYKVTSRFTILPPVPYDKVVDYIKDADLGIISVQPVTLSYQYSMPNKLFELSFARVPIISNELDEIQEFLEEHNNGIAIDINNMIYLTHYISKLMKTKEKYIMSDDQYENLVQQYSWEKQLEKLFVIYSNTLGLDHQKLELTTEDIKLRSIGKILNQSEFDPVRAGLVDS